VGLGDGSVAVGTPRLDPESFAKPPPVFKSAMAIFGDDVSALIAVCAEQMEENNGNEATVEAHDHAAIRVCMTSRSPDDVINCSKIC